MTEASDAEFTALAEKEAAHRILGGSDFAANMRRQMVEMAEWARGIVEVRAWAADQVEEVKTFGDVGVAGPGSWAMQWAPRESVALLGMPIGVEGLVAVTKALEVAYGKDLVIRTDQQGIDGWMLIARPEQEVTGA